MQKSRDEETGRLIDFFERYAAPSEEISYKLHSLVNEIMIQRLHQGYAH